MEKIRILCYGDSNTWGYIPGSNHLRFGNNERWTRILAKKLGKKFEIIEEGLNSRTIVSEDERNGKEGKNGSYYLIPCLDTNDPIDLVIVMLGTNELKNTYGYSIEQIGDMFDIFIIKTIINRKSQFLNKYPKVLIIAPPIANDDGSGKYKNAYEKSLRFNEIYKKIALKNNCYFIDNEGLETGIDKIHLSKESHALLAKKVKNEIDNIYNKKEQS